MTAFAWPIRKSPVKAIAGFRDVAAHKCQTLRMEDAYTTVKDDFPDLREMPGEMLEAGNVDGSGE